MELSKEVVQQCLKGVIDPEVNLNIVDMGLIYGLTIEAGVVQVEMTLTTRGCPMRNYMESAVHEALDGLEGVREVKIEFVWTPPWSPDKINRDALEQLR